MLISLGASAYVRDSADEGASPMEMDPITAGLAQIPSVSIIEKNARVMRWLMSCKKSGLTGGGQGMFRSPRGSATSGPTPALPQRHTAYKASHQTRRIPPPSPRVRRAVYATPGPVVSAMINVPKESDV